MSFLINPYSVASAAAYSAEAVALFASMTSEPDDTRKGHINDLILALKGAGIWAKLDRLFILAAHDLQASGLEWLTAISTLTQTGTPVFTADRGWAVSSTHTINTGYNPSSNAVNFALNSAHFALWSRTSGAALGSSVDTGSIGIGQRMGGGLRSSTDTAAMRLNDSTTDTATSTDGSGLFVFNRPDSATKQIFRNGSQLGSNFSRSSTSVANTFFNTTGSNEREFAAMAIGGGLTSTEIANYYTAVHDYMVAVGAG